MTPKFAGIDVSQWQGEIDFKAVKEGKIKGLPVSFVMIRATVNKSVDKYAVKNVNAALNAGLKVGLYHYSYATTPQGAEDEAELILNFIKDNGFDGKIELPIAFDIEENGVFKLGKATVTAIAKAFMDKISKANYQPILYTYAAAYNAYLDKNAVKDYPLWISGFITENALNNKFGIKDYAAWQFGVAGHPSYDIQIIGKVNGVKGQCDVDYMYEDLAEKIRVEGKNKFLTEIPENQTPTQDKPATDESETFNVGQVVEFLGGKHYGASNSASSVGGERSKGNATITAIAKGTKHPYHLIGTKGGSNVYGWVDEGTFVAINDGKEDENTSNGNDEVLKVGQKVKIKQGAKDLNTKGCFVNWVYNTALYVREIKGDRIVVSTQLSGAVTGVVSKQDIIII